MSNWNLSKLYTSINDEKFIKDQKTLTELITKINEYTKELNNEDINNKLINTLKLMEEYTVLVEKLASFLSLSLTTDTTNKEVTSAKEILYGVINQASKPMAVINLWIKDLDFNEIDFNNSYLKEYTFMLNEIKDGGKYLLSDGQEEVISKLRMNGSSKWSDLQEYLTSILSIELNGKEYNLPSIRNMAYDSDPKVRKEAYYAELESYKQIKEPLAFSLNSIKGEANTIAELRGYESVLDMTLINSRLKKETLDAMLEAIKDALPAFRKYLRRKAELLGYENGLPFYDMFAPMGHSDKRFTIEESKDYLINSFKETPKIAELIKEAYENDWIDFLPKNGKVGGAFCSNLTSIKESRILTNFDGSLSDVVTLAHELGHAYHGYCIQNHLPLNTDYSMPVAETASIFNETIVMNKVISESKSKEEKILLLESSLQDSTQVIVDILSRYIFETNVVNKRKDGFMFADELSEMMLEAQKEAYGDGLDHSLLHPYMWVNKGHYYSAGLNFYNFPYAFGLLFAKGLYSIYEVEKESFLNKYDSLLEATTVNNVEEVAKIANVDLTDKEFWTNSINIIVRQIEEFIEITK